MYRYRSAHLWHEFYVFIEESILAFRAMKRFLVILLMMFFEFIFAVIKFIISPPRLVKRVGPKEHEFEEINRANFHNHYPKF